MSGGTKKRTKAVTSSSKPTAIEKLVAKSGNSFHFEAVRAFRSLGWTVQISPYYSDSVTDKSRELDLIAEKVYPINQLPFPNPAGNLIVRFCVECKYFPPEVTTAFWFDNKDLEMASRLITSSMYLDAPQKNVLAEKHHYYSERSVAKLFDSDARDLMQNALNQCLNGTIYFRQHSLISLDSPLPSYRVSYPLIFCNTFDRFYAVDQSARGAHTQITKPFQIEVHYAYLDQNKVSQKEYFLVDAVQSSQLPDFLSMLESQDLLVIRERLGWESRSKQ